MICVGIDVAKDKHDCIILNSEGKVLAGVFTIPNNVNGFDTLLQKIHSCTSSDDKIKVGLEATGHYSYNILGFLLNQVFRQSWMKSILPLLLSLAWVFVWEL